MGFPAESFYRLATLLQRQSQGDDAQLRTCISRAYYSAFLTARDHSQKSSKGRRGHVEIIEYYLNSNDEREQLIGSDLDTLKSLRVQADYRVDIVCTTQDGSDAMRLAGKLLRLLKTLPPAD